MGNGRARSTALGARPARWLLGWRPSATVDPEQRRRILGALYPEAGGVRHWWFRYGVMLALSVVLAVLGLSLDSTAVVIGAMLIAPLMTPVLGISAALVMAWPRRLLQSGLAVVAGTAGAVGISWVLTSLLPASDQALTPAVLSRTSPTLLDLLVALAAGAAGAYATTREDVSAVLPGVAVAVALVPPLAAVGFTLATGRTDLAGGAVLLFAANLVAIVVVGALVLLGSGFVPSGRLEIATHRISAGLVAAVIALVAVAVPLGIATLANAKRAQTTQAVNEDVVSWIAPYPGLKLSGVTINGARVTVNVVGSVAPPPSATLLQVLTGLLGSGAAVRVDWFQSTVATGATKPTAPSLTLAVLRPLVDAWLGHAPGGAGGTRVVVLTTTGDAVSVDLVGASAPPPADLLAEAIRKHVDRTVTVSVSWRMPSQTSAQVGLASAAAAVGGGTGAQAVVVRWLAEHPGVDLLGVTQTAGLATVDLAGTDPALVTPDLRAALATALGPDVAVEIRFARLETIGP